MSKLTRYLVVFGLLAILAMVPVLGAGCSRQQPTATPTGGIDLSKTMVPNIDLDAYVYVKQDTPTQIPNKIAGVPSGVAVESLSLWAIVSGNTVTTSGALVMTKAADASDLRGKIPSRVWTSISDRTVYFVDGTGTAADNLKAAISKNDFKAYSDPVGLAQAARLPNGGNMKLAGIAEVKPSAQVVALMGNVTGQNMVTTISSMLAAAQLGTVTLGLYSPGHIEVTDMAERLDKGTLWEANLGVVALVQSALPGAVVVPVAGKLLENAGFTQVAVNNVTLYKGTLQSGGKTFPIFLNLDGNNLSMSASGQENYAQTLITNIKK